MNKYNQQVLLEKLQNQTEEIVEKAISVWQLTPHHNFARKPAAEAWSANECLQHLNDLNPLLFSPASARIFLQAVLISYRKAKQFCFHGLLTG